MCPSGLAGSELERGFGAKSRGGKEKIRTTEQLSFLPQGRGKGQERRGGRGRRKGDVPIKQCPPKSSNEKHGQ